MNHQMHPELELQRMAHRRRELMRQARLERLVREARADQPARHRRWLALLGDIMVAQGMRLRRAGAHRPPRILDWSPAEFDAIARR